MSNLREMVEVADVAHSGIGPSSAERWMNCAACVGFLKRAGLDSEESGEEAARGTVAHSIGAECLLTGQDAWEFSGQIRKHEKWEFEVDGDMVVSVQTWLDFVREKMKQFESKGAMLYVERRVWSDYDDEAFGTSDTIIEVPGDRLIIIDFKNGMIIVEPTTPQLKLYGQYSYERRSEAMRGKGEPNVIELFIVQPRMPHPKGVIRRHVTNADELENWMLSDVMPAIIATRDPQALFTIGDHCRYCPGNTSARCPAMKSQVLALPVDKPVEALTNEEIAHFRKIKGVVTKFFEGVNKEAFLRVKEKGEEIEGCKLVHKTGDRVFRSSIVEKDAETDTERTVPLLDALKATFGEDKIYQPAKVKSPAMIEKMPGGKSFTSLWAYKPDTGYTLADEDDAREPAVGLMQLADQAAGGIPI